MKAEMIAVGNEIISGKTINTDASYIATALQSIGVTPLYHTAIGDYQKDIEEALAVALKRVDVVCVSGGLGPTEDDLTKETVCKYLGYEMDLCQEAYDSIVVYFKKIDKPMLENNKKQAYFPQEAVVLPNLNGTAPGCILEKNNQYVILLPGPPKELIPMFERSVLPYLKERVTGVYELLDIKFFGIGESQLAQELKGVLREEEDLSVAPYIGKYEVIVRVRSFAQTKKEAISKVEEIKKEIVQRLGKYIIGYNESKLEEEVVACLKKLKYTLATAESCTGGMLASTLINCSGASSVFEEGFITYSNQAKQKYLSVKEKTLIQYGAVSEETAKEMALGVKIATGATIGVSITGIAGPDGGTKEKPVGLVYIGIATSEEVKVYKLMLQGERKVIREKTVKNALYQLYNELK